MKRKGFIFLAVLGIVAAVVGGSMTVLDKDTGTTHKAVVGSQKTPATEGSATASTNPTTGDNAVEGARTADGAQSFGAAAPVPSATGAFRLIIPRLGVDSPTVVLGVDGAGAMQSPVKPMDVGWYNFSGEPGKGGNAVVAGHVDYVNYGPAAFWGLRELQVGDLVEASVADGQLVKYRVSAVTSYEFTTAPLMDIIGPTATESITLITCTGSFNSRTREYDHRLVVRAERI